MASLWPSYLLVFLPAFCLLLQTFQKVEDAQEADYENVTGEKSPLMESFSQNSLYKRKTTRGSSFASEGKMEEKEKLKHDQDKTELVSCKTSLVWVAGKRPHFFQAIIGNVILEHACTVACVHTCMQLLTVYWSLWYALCKTRKLNILYSYKVLLTLM